MNGTAAIIDVLVGKQQELKEKDAAFAKRIGVSRQAWQMMRTGDTGIGTETLQRVATAFPDIAPKIIALFLPENASMLTNSGRNTSQ